MLTIRNRPQWRVVVGGSWQYLEPLTRPYADRIRTSAVIEHVRPTAGEVAGIDGGLVNDPTAGAGQAGAAERWRVLGRQTDAAGNVQPIDETFDHVVFACHADQALRILEPPAGSLLRGTLSAFSYQSNQATLHTDDSVLPRRRRAWAAWNYRLPATSASANGVGEQATVTYNMNRLQGFSDTQTLGQTFCVTLNEDAAIDPAKVIERLSYAHPIFRSGGWPPSSGMTT